MNPETQPAEHAIEPGRDSPRSGEAAGSASEVLEALKECEYALYEAVRTDKIGWLQETAHATAIAALSKATGKRIVRQNDRLEPSGVNQPKP